ncbi:MAG: hypothetical protein OXE99_00110, partial [Cellvibrionales bacterium]|nr:hypothetical protein [Cellvibrionales bacterium]
MCRLGCFLLFLIFSLSSHGDGHSQAHNHQQLFQAQVNTATGSFIFSYPLINAIGRIEPFHFNLSYRFNKKGMFGLPTGWAFDIDYIDNKTAILGGKHWLIDEEWSDETEYKSGLKYFNQHGSKFIDEGEAKPIPTHPGLNYRYKAIHKDGSLKYFSHQGLLVLSIDRFNNAITYRYDMPINKLEDARITEIDDNFGNKYSFTYEPDSLTLTYPDGNQHKIFYNDQGVNDIINPLNQRFHISYVQAFDYSLIRSITTPSGLITQLIHDSVPYRKGSATKQMPVVTYFRQYDLADHKVHHDAHYSYAKGNNYTGYPNYALNDTTDSLMDSGNEAYRYAVDVIQTDGNTPSPQLYHQTFIYNYLHLPVEILTFNQSKPYSRTTHKYDLSPFKYSQSTNYDKPVETIHWVWSEKAAYYLPCDKTTHSYDRYGNKLTEAHWVFNRDTEQWQAIRSTHLSYDENHYSLLQEAISVDEVSGMQLRKSYALTDDKKNHGRIRQYYKLHAKDADWSPWQQTIEKYDSNGRQIYSELSWLAIDKPGVQKTHYTTEYQFDETTALLTTSHTSALGAVHKETIDTKIGKTIKKVSPMGEVITFSYDAIYQPLVTIDPLGFAHSVTHQVFQKDGINAETSETPLGYKIQKVFDASHREIKHQDEYQGHWRMLQTKIYNAWGKVIKISDLQGSSA